MLRSLALILSLLLTPAALAQSADDVAANRLLVEAVQLWNRAEGESVNQRAATLQKVQSNLKTIIERHGGSTLAVRLVIGETVGPLSVASVDRAARAAAEARAAEARAAEARAAEARAAEARAAEARAAAEAEAGAAVEARARAARAAGVDVSFRDCPECPEMGVVPAGSTRLASGRNVTIATPFAVGKFEVTFAEWDACVAQGGCSHRPDDRGWGRGRQPVMNVNWDDAQQYVAWLSRKTGKAYRLLSEAEWEYAAQAGIGREAKVTPGAGEANCDGCGSRWDGKQTAPVGSFAANAFGLHDMLGNVDEWTADCWNDSHDGAPAQQPAFDPDALLRSLRPMPQQAQQRQQQAAATPGTGDGRAPNAPLDPLRPLSSEEVEDKWVKNPGAPADGSARQGGDCSRRVLRGGSWLLIPVSTRSASRLWYSTGDRDDDIGFRVARTL